MDDMVFCQTDVAFAEEINADSVAKMERQRADYVGSLKERVTSRSGQRQETTRGMRFHATGKTAVSMNNQTWQRRR